MPCPKGAKRLTAPLQTEAAPKWSGLDFRPYFAEPEAEPAPAATGAVSHAVKGIHEIGKIIVHRPVGHGGAGTVEAGGGIKNWCLKTGKGEH